MVGLSTIPKAALMLGVAGLAPFVWGALLVSGLMPSAQLPLPAALLADGRVVLTGYGGVILSFMAGVLWGFATKAQGQRALLAYTLSVVPALWWFLAPSYDAASSLGNLLIGFMGLLVLDAVFYKWGLTPSWWMALRIRLSAVVLACLLVGLVA